MRCPSCSGENPLAAASCAHCGTGLQLFCATCNTPQLPHFRFCSGCGTRLEAGTLIALAPGVEGERRHVSVMFADMTGSLELIRDRDPEEARAIFDRVVDAIRAAIHRHKGTVNRVMGDGVLALFGAPTALEHHAVHACRAAFDVLETVQALSAGAAAGSELRMHIGIDTGEVVVRSVTTDLHTEYDAVGRTVHVAARLQALAPAGTTRISAQTAAAVRQFLTVRSLGHVPIKGLAEELEIFEPVEVGTVSRFDVSKRRGLTRFVGRTREIHALTTAAQRVRDGVGELWALSGEPGTGKTRLVHEFCRGAAEDGWVMLRAECSQQGATAGLGPVIQLLRTHFAISDSQSRAEIVAAVSAASADREDAGFVASATLSLLGIQVEDPAWLAADATTRRRAVAELLCSLFLPLSHRQPVILVVEDLQWIDPESATILDSLVRQLPRGRILALVNFRPEYRNRWRRQAHVHDIALDPLAPAPARALLDELLEDEAGLREVKEMLLARTSGNPLFIEESVRALIDRGVIARQDGRLTLIERLDSVRIPQTIQSILAGRVDLLAPYDKAVLQCASVAGATFLVELLGGVVEAEPQLVGPALERLVAGGFLARLPGRERREIAFKHPLIHEIAYAGMLKTRRRKLHRRALAALESLYAGRVGEISQILAEHARLGEVWESCARHLRQAAQNAYARSANIEASRLYEQALEALASAPAGRATSELRVDLCLDLRNSLLLIGEIGKILAYLTEAESVAAELGDRRRVAKLASSLSHAYWVTGDAPRALQHAEMATQHAEALGDSALAIPARYHAALIMKDLGRFPEANRLLQALILGLGETQRYERFGLNAPLSVLAGSYLTRSLAEVGEFPAALAQGAQSFRIANELDLGFGRAMAQLGLGYAHLIKSEADAAGRHFEQAAERFKSLSNRTMETVVLGFLGWARLQAGEHAEALTLVAESVRRADAMNLMSQQPLRLALLGECRRVNGDLAAALATSSEAIRLARQQRENGSEAYAQWLRGLALLDDSRAVPVHAIIALLRAIVLAQRSGMRPLAATCRFVLAEIYRALGRGARAGQEAAAAVEEFRRLDMKPPPPRLRAIGLTAAG